MVSLLPNYDPSHLYTKPNILVNRDRRACIADFGLSTTSCARAHATATDSDAVSISTFLSGDSLMSFTPGGTTRWMSPELLDPERFGVPESEGDRPTRESDSYALGMVIYEVGPSANKSFDASIQYLTFTQVLCGHVPYYNLVREAVVMGAIVEGDRPKKPKNASRLGFTEELWKTIEQCWLEDRNARPSVETIRSRLNDAAPFWCARE